MRYKSIHKISLDESIVLHRRFWRAMSLMAFKHKKPNPAKVVRYLGYNPRKLLRHNFLCTYGAQDFAESKCEVKPATECQYCPVKFTDNKDCKYTCLGKGSKYFQYRHLMNELAIRRHQFTKWYELETVCAEIAELPTTVLVESNV